MNVAMTDIRMPSEGFLASLWRWVKMHLLEFNSNPTRKWVRDPEVELILDLDNNTFSGIGYGVPYTALSLLGSCEEFMRIDGFELVDEDGRRIESKPEKIYGFHYHSKGFGFDADEKLEVESFHINLRPNPEVQNSRAFTGKVLWENRAVDFAALANTESLARLLGPPERDVENPGGEEFGGPQRYLDYTRPKASWTIHADEAGNTTWFSISRKIPDASSDTGRIEEVV